MIAVRLGLVVLAVLVCAGGDAQDRAIPHAKAVVAVVDGKPITFGDVWSRLRRRLEGAHAAWPGERFQAYARRELRAMRQELIERELFMAKVKEEGLRVSQKHVEHYAEWEMERLNAEGENLINLEDFWDAVYEIYGFSEREYRKELEAKVAVSHYLHTYVWKPEYFSPEVLRSYYREHQDDYRAGGYVAIRQVYVQREHPDFEKIIDTLEAQVGTKDFETIAREAIEKGYSFLRGSDGVGRYVFRLGENPTDGEKTHGRLNSLRTPLPKKIRSLKVGEISEPIPTPTGTYFIQLLQRGGGRVKSFPEVQARIQRELRLSLEVQTRQECVEKLARGAQITYLDFPEETPLGRIEWPAEAATKSAGSSAANDPEATS